MSRFQSSRRNFAMTGKSVDGLQHEAVNRIGRKLTDDELYVASKGIKSGPSFDVETVFQTAIEEAVRENPKAEWGIKPLLAPVLSSECGRVCHRYTASLKLL